MPDPIWQIIYTWWMTYLLSSIWRPPRSGVSVSDDHRTWFSLIKYRAKKRSQPNSSQSTGRLPIGTCKYLHCSTATYRQEVKLSYMCTYHEPASSCCHSVVYSKLFTKSIIYICTYMMRPSSCKNKTLHPCFISMGMTIELYSSFEKDWPSVRNWKRGSVSCL